MTQTQTRENGFAKAITTVVKGFKPSKETLANGNKRTIQEIYYVKASKLKGIYTSHATLRIQFTLGTLGDEECIRVKVLERPFNSIAYFITWREPNLESAKASEHSDMRIVSNATCDMEKYTTTSREALEEGFKNLEKVLRRYLLNERNFKLMCYHDFELLACGEAKNFLIELMMKEVDIETYKANIEDRLIAMENHKIAYDNWIATNPYHVNPCKNEAKEA